MKNFVAIALVSAIPLFEPTSRKEGRDFDS